MVGLRAADASRQFESTDPRGEWRLSETQVTSSFNTIYGQRVDDDPHIVVARSELERTIVCNLDRKCSGLPGKLGFEGGAVVSIGL